MPAVYRPPLRRPAGNTGPWRSNPQGVPVDAPSATLETSIGYETSGSSTHVLPGRQLDRRPGGVAKLHGLGLVRAHPRPVGLGATAEHDGRPLPDQLRLGPDLPQTPL